MRVPVWLPVRRVPGEVQGVRRLGSRWFRVTAQVPAHPRYTKTVVPIGIPFLCFIFPDERVVHQFLKVGGWTLP